MLCTRICWTGRLPLKANLVFASRPIPHPHTATRTLYHAHSLQSVSAASVAYPDISTQVDHPTHSDPQTPARSIAQFSLYKAGGALQAKVISPTWKLTSSGIGAQVQSVVREGALFLEFASANANSGSNPGERTYNWGDKQTFALSPLELGHFLDPPAQGVKSLYHDTSKMKGSSAQGKTTKSLSFNPAQDGDWFLSLSATTGGGTKKFSVAFKRHEYAVFKTLIQDIIPHLYGFDLLKVTNFNEQQPYPSYSGSQPPF